jgi:hypothetical protein
MPRQRRSQTFKGRAADATVVAAPKAAGGILIATIHALDFSY